MLDDLPEADRQYGAITNDGIAFMRSQIGVRRPVPAWNRCVTEDGIEHFALGIGDDNPLWWDHDYALASSWRSRVAPPCYLYAHCNGPRLRPEQGHTSVEIFLPGTLGLLVQETWRWHRVVRRGDVIHADSALTVVTEQESSFGGRSVDQIEALRFLDQDQTLVAEIDQKIRRFDRQGSRAGRAYLGRPLAQYTEHDRARFVAQYESEVAMRRGAELRYFEDTKVGELLGPMLKGPLTLTNQMGFMLGIGCPNTPTNRMASSFLKLHPGQRLVNPVTGVADTLRASHLEQAIAQASGLPTGYDLGMARLSWFSHLLTDWMGDDGFLTELSVQFRRPNFFGDITWLSGKIEIRDEIGGIIEASLVASNQLDEVTAKGTARVRLPRRKS